MARYLPEWHFRQVEKLIAQLVEVYPNEFYFTVPGWAGTTTLNKIKNGLNSWKDQRWVTDIDSVALEEVATKAAFAVFDAATVRMRSKAQSPAFTKTLQKVDVSPESTAFPSLSLKTLHAIATLLDQEIIAGPFKVKDIPVSTVTALEAEYKNFAIVYDNDENLWILN